MLTAFTQSLSTLAWRPFLDPIPIDGYWILLFFPVAVVIAVVYKTLKLDNLKHLPRAATWLTIQITVFMIISGLVLWAMSALF
ncbi:hypothetical protein [Poriferisphaera sp. WC338]|uniref:hypothetical protein n=1 Tax=Poriferisphaera sp. WC338 TaxID=3425129 RepID=UPI003D81A2AE